MIADEAAASAGAALADVEALLLDLDGVVYRGANLLPGAREFFEYLRVTGLPFVALTNHSGRRAPEYAAKLADLGVDVAAERIVTSGWATARYLAWSHPGAGVYVVGSPALEQELLAEGCRVAARPQFVVTGFMAKIQHDRLLHATEHLLRGARLIATNPDPLLPVADGFIPECGPLTAFLECAGNCRATVVGKPNPWIVDLAIERLGVPRDRCLIVGDTLATDIAAGTAAGIRTALMLTGNTASPPEGFDGFVAADLHALRRGLEGARPC